jgi:zinc transporter, ZIP family
MPLWLASLLWGLLGGSAVMLGALIGFYARVPERTIASIMAFGSGVLISALAFDLMDEAFKRGGFNAVAIGFLGGSAVYTAANWFLSHHGHDIESGPEISSLQSRNIPVADWRLRWVLFSMAYRNRSQSESA